MMMIIIILIVIIIIIIIVHSPKRLFRTSTNDSKLPCVCSVIDHR